jgi:hypothetical protein
MPTYFELKQPQKNGKNYIIVAFGKYSSDLKNLAGSRKVGNFAIYRPQEE